MNYLVIWLCIVVLMMFVLVQYISMRWEDGRI